MNIEAQFDGLVHYLENEYLSDRYSGVERRDNGVIVIRSGENPAFTRFQDDMVPILHRFGYVLVKGNGGLPGDSRNWIRAEPMQHAILENKGRLCKRGACRAPAALGSEKCRPCGAIERAQPQYIKDFEEGMEL